MEVDIRCHFGRVYLTSVDEGKQCFLRLLYLGVQVDTLPY